jgi:N12 class adenine-specific DNA methylase
VVAEPTASVFHEVGAGKTAEMTFEQTGIDYLVVDELHEYKNLLTPSNFQDAAIAPGSMRASDLHMKIEYCGRATAAVRSPARPRRRSPTASPRPT